ncbi:MAG: NAD(P)/FAD-dependent oxidoreductase [Parvibaculaceae bacterium]
MEYKVAVIGAGIAGASAAARIAETRSTILIEREAQPGYHASGRSAAMFTETYGNSAIRALTIASRAFLSAPPAGFADAPILGARGALFVGGEPERDLLGEIHETAHRLVPSVRRVSADEVVAKVPAFRRDRVAGGVFEPDAMDIDTHGLLQGFLRQLRAHGGKILLDAEVLALSHSSGGWHIETRNGTVRAQLIVNAAGPWADEIARLAGAAPTGMTPKRRTAFLFQPAGYDVGAWPLSIGAREDFYFKPDAGNLLVSPADETPSSATDAQPEEIDIAIAADRVMAMTHFDIRHIAHRWAGLRTFAPDKTPIVGFDPEVADFLWLAGQGGYGFQTSPALAGYAADLVAGRPLAARLKDLGLTAGMLSPARFREPRRPAA